MSRCQRLVWLGSLGYLLCGCGGAQPSPAQPSPRAAATAPSASPGPAPAPEIAAPVPQVEESPGFADTMARLRPSGTEAALSALAAAPTQAEAYARAALAYAPTEAPAMTLIWGLSYQAMGGGSQDAAVADALAKVLRERVVAKRDEQTHEKTFTVRLAPGQAPVRKTPDGVAHVPVAHLFEGLFSPALTGLEGAWTVEQFYDALSGWVAQLASHGSPLDERVELDAWLVATAKAGHLEAYCHTLLGPAFPAELKQFRRQNAAALKAYESYVNAAPLRPTRPVMPDDLVALPPPP